MSTKTTRAMPSPNSWIRRDIPPDLADSNGPDDWKARALVGRVRRLFDGGEVCRLSRIELRAPGDPMGDVEHFLFRVNAESLTCKTSVSAVTYLPSDPRSWTGAEVLRKGDDLADSFSRSLRRSIEGFTGA